MGNQRIAMDYHKEKDKNQFQVFASAGSGRYDTKTVD